MNQTILGIDIGSTKVCSIIASIKDGIPHIIGTGFSKAQGIKKGAITNIEQASRAIRASANEAKRMAGVNDNKAIISVSGVYTKSTNSSGVVNIPANEIGLKEINRVIQTALYNATIPTEYEVIHILPYNFKLDDQDYIDNPMGMSGTRLEVFVHIITAQRSGLENLKKAVRGAGIEIENIVLASYASSIAILSEDEKELGIACIDMGGNTCDLMIHQGNAMRYNDVIKVGSSHITSDLAMALNTTIMAAEKVKSEYGDVSSQSEGSNDKLELPSIGNENSLIQVPLTMVHNVIYLRVLETINLISSSIEKSGLKDQLGAGIILTGGMTNLKGLKELVSAIFPKLPVRLGRNIEIVGLFDNLKDLSNSAAIGLILYGAGKFTNYEMDSNKKIRYLSEREDTPQVENKEKTGESPEGININSILEDSDLVKLKTANQGLFSRFYNWLTQLF